MDAAAGHWLASQVSIANVAGVNELRLTGGVDGTGHPIGGAALWHGLSNAAEIPSGRIEYGVRYDTSTGFAGVCQLWPNTDANWPTHGEMDMTEWGSGSRTTTQTNIHYSATVNAPDHDTYNVGSGIDFSQWHDVAFEWQQGSYCAMWVDGAKTMDTRDGTGMSYQWGASRIVIPAGAATSYHAVFQMDFLDSNLAHYESSGVAMHIKYVRMLVPA